MHVFWNSNSTDYPHINSKNKIEILCTLKPDKCVRMTKTSKYILTLHRRTENLFHICHITKTFINLALLLTSKDVN